RTRVGDVMYCPVVFSAGTAGWGQRLLRTNPDANVERITLNLIDRLASRQVSPPPGATTEFALRSNTLPTKRWQEVPTGPTSITAAAVVIGSSPEGHLFVCAGGRLYRRAPVS